MHLIFNSIFSFLLGQNYWIALTWWFFLIETGWVQALHSANHFFPLDNNKNRIDFTMSCCLIIKNTITKKKSFCFLLWISFLWHLKRLKGLFFRSNYFQKIKLQECCWPVVVNFNGIYQTLCNQYKYTFIRYRLTL